jgi:hypothetical protein
MVSSSRLLSPYAFRCNCLFIIHRFSSRMDFVSFQEVHTILLVNFFLDLIIKSAWVRRVTTSPLALQIAGEQLELI